MRMDIEMRVKILDSSFVPKEKHFVSNEEMKMIKGILCLWVNTSKETFSKIRNEVVNHYADMKQCIRECEIGNSNFSTPYNVISDKESAIIGTLDQFAYDMGWMN